MEKDTKRRRNLDAGDLCASARETYAPALRRRDSWMRGRINGGPALSKPEILKGLRPLFLSAPLDPPPIRPVDLWAAYHANPAHRVHRPQSSAQKPPYWEVLRGERSPASDLASRAQARLFRAGRNRP